MSVDIKNTFKDKRLLIELAVYTLYLVILITISSIFKFQNTLQAYQSFDITDPTLQYLHKSSRVSGNSNIAITTLFLFCVILYRSFLETRLQHRHTPSLRCHVFVFEVVFAVLAIVETNCLTNFLKTVIGNPKPHFMKECDPDLSLLESGRTWVNETLTRTICRNTHDVDFRRSFPSGHMSQAAVCTTYGVLLLQFVHSDYPFLNFALTRIIQFLAVFYAALIAAFRINGHHHHWYDVLGGLILGSTLATLTYLSKEYRIARLQHRELVPTTTAADVVENHPGGGGGGKYLNSENTTTL